MADNDFWEYPPEQGVAQHGEFRLTLIERPLPTGGGVLPAHDPARAREFAAAFGTIDTVVEEADRIEATERPPFVTRADLDLVGVGCWGTVTEINDPALVFTGGTFPLAEQEDETGLLAPGASGEGPNRSRTGTGPTRAGRGRKVRHRPRARTSVLSAFACIPIPDGPSVQ
ncbi:DUF6333 family protein [Streptomyces sp. NPDC057543]|uniref:DUF6333 family protein n=1 Tax=Streptomyces sp. NPDC057543 TaxID=3346163 RepID=UPI0036AA3285